MSTPLQAWCSALFDLLDNARGDYELDERGYAAFLDIACHRLAREVARTEPGTDEWLREQMGRAA